MKNLYEPGQQVYFLTSGHVITESTVVKSSSWLVTIRFNKTHDESIIRLPYSRIYSTKEEARKHIHPDLPPKQSTVQEKRGEYVSTRRWELWE